MEEDIGFGAVTQADKNSDNVPAAGCLSGYKLGFERPAGDSPVVSAGRSLAETEIVTLQGVITINSESVDEELAEEEIALIAEEITIERQEHEAEEEALEAEAQNEAAQEEPEVSVLPWEEEDGQSDHFLFGMPKITTEVAAWILVLVMANVIIYMFLS